MPDSKRPRRPDHAGSQKPNRGISSLRRGDFATGELGLGVRLIHEDEDVLVVDKPPGLVTAPMPGTGDATTSELPSVFAVVKRYVRSKKRRNARAWIIHRLDKESSGLLVFAKTERAFEWLKEDFRARRVHRLYLAVVEGEFAETAKTGTIQSFVAENERGLMQSVAGGGRPVPTAPRGPRRDDFLAGRDAHNERNGRSVGGHGPRTPERVEGPQLAVTHYRVVASSFGRSLVQLRLGTGRKNQIRVHMTEAGHPLVGDYRYRPSTDAMGATVPDPLRRLCLHAVELGFSHPSSGESRRFTSPAPEGFWGLVGAQPRALDADTEGMDAMSESQDSENKQTTGTPEGVAQSAPNSVKYPQQSRSENSAPVETSWDHVAGWYEQLLDQGRSDHHLHVILPGALRLLRATRGMRVLDVACGQGVLCRQLEQLGVEAVGVDASPKLIEAARRATPARPDPKVTPARFEVGDARSLRELNLGQFDAAASVMALMNIDPLEAVVRGCAALLKPGGAFVGVILHPAFRAPGQTSWGFDKSASKSVGGSGSTSSNKPEQGAERETKQPRVSSTRQYRRVDGYLSMGQTPIVMNPGHAAHGKAPVTTWTFHRPIQTYVRVLSEAGFLIESLEEWPSLRQSQPGPLAREENRIRREIPMFLGFRAIKRA